MNLDPEEFLQAILSEYLKDLDGQPPNESEYLNRVWGEGGATNGPFSGLDAKEIDEFAHQVFASLEIREVEAADTLTKERDAKANLNNRRYVDGSF